MALPTGSHYNKIIFGGQTLMDISGDTVDPAHLLDGITAHDKTGAAITGACTYDSDTTDASSTASEILAGKTAYVNKNKLTGTMPNNEAVAGVIASKDETYTVPQGYHDGSGTVAISDAEKAKLIPENIKKDIVLLGVTGTMDGTESVTAQAKSVTPSASEQVIVSDAGYDYLSQVTVLAIPYTETDNAAGGKTVSIAASA